MKIDIKGTIVPDDYAEVYEWLGLSYTSPKSITLPDGKEDIEVSINSFGGDVYAGAEIYTKLKNYPGKVTTIVTGLAASMASIIAMAGDKVKISPVGSIMIHNVSTYAEGDKNTMRKEAEVLHSFDRTLTNAYKLKTGLSEEELLELMNKETWLSPKDALEKGFVDEILFDDKDVPLLAAGYEMLSNEAIKEARKAMMMMEKTKTEETLKNEKTESVEETEKEEVVNAEEEEKPEEEQEDKPQEEKPEESEEETEEEEAPEEETEEEKRATNKKMFNNIKNRRTVPEFKNEADISKLEIIAGGKEEMKNTYKNAFLNAIRGKELSVEDKQAILENNKMMNNAFVHDTTNTAIVIPRETQDKIWARATEGYGVLEDVNRLHVKGELRMVKHTAIDAGDAKWYVEATQTEDEKNTFGELILKGNELSKAITISWKLRAMAMDDFENFLIREIGERMAIALGTSVTQGSGNNEPTGIITALKNKADQKLSVAKTGELTYSELLKAIAKVHSSYKTGTKIYANSTVIWTVLANVLDGNGRPFFEATAGQDGVGNALGFVVKEDASLKNDEILIGNPSQGYVFNVNEEMSMTTEDHAKARNTDFVAYMIADGNVLDEKAFAILSLTQAA